MGLTLAQLRTPVSRDEAREVLIQLLAGAGFQPTNWESGGVQRTLFEMSSEVYARLTEMVAELARGQYGEDAGDEYLEHFSESHYDNAPLPAVATQGKLKFTCAAGQGPYSPGVGDLVAASPTRTFRLIEAGTIPDGDDVDLTVECETPGAAGNVGNNTITTLQTPLAGVTVNNPVFANGTWITRLGEDKESAARLRLRNRSKWSTLAAETVKARVVLIALEASNAVAKVGVDDQNPRGAGTVDVYVAGELAAVGGGDVTAVQAALAGRFFGDGMSRVQTFASTTLALDAGGTIYFDPDFTAAVVQEGVEAAVLEFLRPLDLGGSDYSPGPVHIVARNDLIDVIKDAPGVKALVLTTPAADVPVATFQLVVPGAYSFTYTALGT